MDARHELLGGKVQVFKRPRSPFWQCSATVGGRQFKASSKQEGLAQAKDFAEDWFLTLRGKDRFGGGIPKAVPKGQLFRDAAKIFIDEYAVLTNGERSPDYVRLLQHKIDKHLNPFFGDKGVLEIDDNAVHEYRIHRAKAVDKDGKPKPPARTTVHHEIIALGHVLKSAKRHGKLHHIPDLSVPYKASGKISHRAWFSLEEYRRFRTATRTRAKSPANWKWKWECEQFHDYVLFMANTGLRPDEASLLEFRDVTITQDDEPIRIPDLDAFRTLIARCEAEGLPEPILRIEVVRGKRGVGICKSMPGAVRPFLRLRSRFRAVPEDRSEQTRDRREKLLSRRPRGTEPTHLRATRRGVSRGNSESVVSPVATDLIFGPTQRELMNSVLNELNMKFDREGQRRTAYSLRHTYICFRLLEGADIYLIAKNCRTSVEMIQKYYAPHIENNVDTAAINIRRVRKNNSRPEGSLTADDD